MKWIKCSESTPPKHRILTSDGKEIHTVIWCEDRECYVSGSGDTCYYCGGLASCGYEIAKHFPYYYLFTHWAELPELPLDSIEN